MRSFVIAVYVFALLNVGLAVPVEVSKLQVRSSIHDDIKL